MSFRKKQTLIGFSVDKINPKKYIRQLRSICKWITFKGRGTILAGTGLT